MPESTADSTALARYEFRRKLEELEQVHGRATELVSLYVPPERQIADVSNYLRGEYAQSSNIKSQSTRKNVMWAISSILNRIKAYRVPPPHGVVLFVGNQSLPGDKTREITYVIEPPESIATFLYRCDSEFYLDPLKEMLAEKEVWGLVVMDRKEATLGRLIGKRIEVIDSFESQVPSKHRMGGQSARRFERLIEDAADKFFVKVGERINGAFKDDPRATKTVLVEHDYLHHELRRKVIGFFDVGYTDESGLKELVENASEALKDVGLMKEKKLVDAFMREVARPEGGLASYGESQIREALKLGAVDILLLSEGLRKYRYRVSCSNPNCAYKAEVTQSSSEFKSGPCPDCKNDSSFLVPVGEPEDVVEELFNLASQMGSRVELISAESTEGKTLLTAFGGLAAKLRYRIH
jgi:peptide chain release factor subunit 1